MPETPALPSNVTNLAAWRAARGVSAPRAGTDHAPPAGRDPFWNILWLIEPHPHPERLPTLAEWNAQRPIREEQRRKRYAELEQQIKLANAVRWQSLKAPPPPHDLNAWRARKQAESATHPTNSGPGADAPD
jgi:hypothetical protein